MSQVPLAQLAPGASQGSALWVLKEVLAGPARQERRTRVLKVLKDLQVLRAPKAPKVLKAPKVPKAPWALKGFTGSMASVCLAIRAPLARKGLLRPLKGRLDGPGPLE